MGEYMGSVEDSTDRTKKPKMNTFSAALLLTAGLVSSAPGGGYYKGFGRSQPSKNVFNTLASDPQFSTLVAAVTAPGLTEILLRHVLPGKVVKLYSSSQSVDNAGGSQLTINGYSVASTAASASVIGKSVASDGRVYAINTVI